VGRCITRWVVRLVLEALLPRGFTVRYRSRTAARGAGIMAFAVAVVTVALAAPAAQADLLNVNPCDGSALSQPFAPWADPAFYELAPGGDFETPSWTLADGAQREPGSEPHAATGTLGSWSLALPAGSSAQSPATCMDAAYPTIRFFIGGTGLVAVSVVDGNLEIPAGVAVAVGDWVPTPVMITGSALTAATSGGTAQVSVRLRSLTGAPRVDDVFIDPWNRG
jgi:hypothetical protein